MKVDIGGRVVAAQSNPDIGTWDIRDEPVHRRCYPAGHDLNAVFAGDQLNRQSEPTVCGRGDVHDAVRVYLYLFGRGVGHASLNKNDVLSDSFADWSDRDLAWVNAGPGPAQQIDEPGG